MPVYEYRVIPAPSKGIKVKGVKTAHDRFAHALQDVMNEMGRDGWEYQRTDTLPAEERSGLAKKTTVQRSVLVFRREKEVAVSSGQPTITATPQTPVQNDPDVAAE